MFLHPALISYKTNFAINQSNNMRTTLVLRKLEKAIAIVELIQKANNNAESARCDLYHWDHAPHPYTSIKLFNTREELSERRIHWLNVAQRLEGYYERTIEGIFQKA